LSLSREPVQNVLTAPGERAARERVEELFARIDELGPNDLKVGAVPSIDLEARETLLTDLEHVADAHGRGLLLDESRGRVRDALLSRGTSWQTTTLSRSGPAGRVEDKVAIVRGLEDAVSVAVVEDILDPETACVLSEPGRVLLGLDPLDPATRDVEVDPGPGEEPASPEAAADDAESELAEAEARDALRLRRGALFVGCGAIALIAAYTVGVGLPGLVLVVLAVGLLAWLFAGS
jgi:hypothetical protein